MEMCALNASALQQSGNGRLTKCVLCSRPLPLCFADMGTDPAEWQCVECGSIYYAVLDVDADPLLVKNVRRVTAEKGESERPSSPADVDTSSFDSFHAQGTSLIAIPDRGPILCQRETPLTRKFDEAIDQGKCLEIRNRGEPFARLVESKGATDYLIRARNELVEYYDASVKKVGELFLRLRAGNVPDVDIITSIAQDALKFAAQDMDMFTCLAINPKFRNYPSRHAQHVAMLATAIATTMGLDKESVAELATGCLLHDAGMLGIGIKDFGSPTILDASKYGAIAEHTITVCDLLNQNIDRLPIASRMVVYQMHERCNGTGYPRGRHTDKIHPLARIAGVADVYIALVSERPHRPGMVPYYAIEKIIKDASQGRFDKKVIRSLLQTVSLFPIGSDVELNDGRVGMVVRTNQKQYTQPVISIPDRGTLSEATTIDLSQQSDLRVLRPFIQPDMGTT